ncbi:MAG: hypothetical protein HPY58_09550 [Firmicutes bacterium]|nr:hypothetical protein [Bacillota bacterium]
MDSHPCASDFHVSVASRRIKLDGAFDFTAEQWSEFVLALLGRMRSRLNNGKLFLGHIKASLEVDRGLIFGSTTGGAAAIKFSEAPIPKSSKALLKTALIAYKIDQGSLENCLLQALDETSQEYGLTYQVEQQEKEEEYL